MSSPDCFRIGFVPMIDCAPVVVAHELGLFAKHGIPVRLSREVGWASIRDRLLHQELHGAHASATMAFAMRCGLGSLAVPCLTAAVLSHNGSAITLSTKLRSEGVTDAATFAAFIKTTRRERKLRLAAVFQYSTQHDHLRQWLTNSGIDPNQDVEIVLIPSPLVHRSLAAGYLDGYCVAEPWNTVAASEQTGWIVEPTSHGKLHVEKVFLVLERFDRTFPEVHLSMVCALQEASQLCQKKEFKKECIRILSNPAYLDVCPDVLKPSLAPGNASAVGGIHFGANELGAPSRTVGRQVFDSLSRLGVPSTNRSFRPDVIPKLFREDLFFKAVKRLPFDPPADAALAAESVTHPHTDPDRSLAA